MSVRAVFDLRPVEWAETLAVLQSVSLADVHSDVRARVVDVAGTLVTIDFPALDGETSPEQLLAACIAGEWADRGDFDSCRLVSVEWPLGFPGPSFGAVEGVAVGAILKPALGLTPDEAARTATRLVELGATLIKDDELQRSSPDRVRAVRASIPEDASRQAKPWDWMTRTSALRTWGSSSTTRQRAAREPRCDSVVTPRK